MVVALYTGLGKSPENQVRLTLSPNISPGVACVLSALCGWRWLMFLNAVPTNEHVLILKFLTITL